MATIDEIAKRAKVSKTTVSFVLNGKPGVSAATAAHVRRVMTEMNYVPSALAQRFASQRSMAVALIALSYRRVFYDPRHAEMVDAVFDRLEARDYSLVLGTSNARFIETKKHMTLLRSGQVDGLLLLEPTLDQSYLADLAAAQAPAVVLNSDGSHVGLDFVRTDDSAVGRMAADFLLRLGHRRIGCIAGSLSHASGRDRLGAFQQVLAQAGCPLAPERTFHGEYDTSEQSGRNGCRAILQRAPDTTAIFCANDTMTVGALAAAVALARPVPQTLSLLGVDDNPACVCCTPQLSSIRQPSYEIARQATDLLLDRISKPTKGPGAPVGRLLAPTLVERASCGPPFG